jgi:hypothetical protein
MSASADENTRSDLLDEFTSDSGETSSYVLWPADPEGAATDRLEIDLDDGQTWSGSSATIEARVTNPAPDEVQAVFRVQGLEPAWCPAPQVVTVVPGTETRLYLKLTPPAGTPPGRYLWSLTAEVPDRQMLALTAALRVDRPKPAVVVPVRSRRRKFTLLLLLAMVVILAGVIALSLLVPSRMPWGGDTTATGPAPRVTAGPSAGPRPSSTVSPTAAAELVRIQGTVLVEDGPGAIRITVVRLSADDLNGVRPSSGHTVLPETTGTDKNGQGKKWSLSLAPGLYGLTFSKPGYTTESIVVTTAEAAIPPPQVRLVRIAPLPTSDAG